MEGGVWWASQAKGLVHDVPTVRELIGRIVAEAESVITDRLGSLVTAPTTV